jgi:hypothetical protein
MNVDIRQRLTVGIGHEAQMPTSGMGQSRRFGSPSMTSGFPPKADTVTAGRHVSKVPILLQKSAVSDGSFGHFAKDDRL